ncbi:hypothetical protein FACS1894110_08220 [Spirochaetia bacterium]|nr:hypothetical protein FACS1894110_08220 [Spirochaetia bacterium]
MGKKFFGFVFMTLIAAGFINAQALDRSQYEETTLFDYKLWANKAQNGETRKFKAPVVFFGQTGTDFYFDDIDGNNFTTFEVEKRWPAMKQNQPVTIYFTGTGRWSCIIDDIDYAAPASAAQLQPSSGSDSAPQPLSTPSEIPVTPVETPESAWAAAETPAPAADPATSESSPDPAEPEVFLVPAELRAPTADPATSESSPDPVTPAASAPGTPVAAAKILGSIPQTGSNKIYRLQTGSFLMATNAVQTFNKLRAAGLNPAYERHGNYTRVVLTKIRADDVSPYAERIAAAGLSEIWCREE